MTSTPNTGSGSGGGQHPRQPRGVPAGGQYAAHKRPEPNVGLDPADADVDEPSGDPAVPDPERLAQATSEDLQTWINHPDPAVQAEALRSPALTDEQLAALADPARDLSVRWQVAIDARPLAGLLAADDPDPTVRALVAAATDTPEKLRAELLADPEVASALARIAADPAVGAMFGVRRMDTDKTATPPDHPPSSP